MELNKACTYLLWYTWCILPKLSNIFLNSIFHGFFNARLSHFLCIFDFLLYPCYSFDMALKNKIYRSFKAKTCTMVDSFTQDRARIDVLGRNKNFQKWSHIFWGTRPAATLFLVIVQHQDHIRFLFLFDKLVIHLQSMESKCSCMHGTQRSMN